MDSHSIFYETFTRWTSCVIFFSHSVHKFLLKMFYHCSKWSNRTIFFPFKVQGHLKGKLINWHSTWSLETVSDFSVFIQPYGSLSNENKIPVLYENSGCPHILRSTCHSFYVLKKKRERHGYKECSNQRLSWYGPGLLYGRRTDFLQGLIKMHIHGGLV